MTSEQVSIDATGEKYTITEVDNSHIPATRTTKYVLLTPDNIPNSCHISFEKKLTQSAKVKKTRIAALKEQV